MNVVVDIGNSMVKIGLFDQNDLIQTHETNENGLSGFLARNPIQVIIVSAVKQIDPETIEECRQSGAFNGAIAEIT